MTIPGARPSDAPNNEHLIVDQVRGPGRDGLLPGVPRAGRFHHVNSTVSEHDLLEGAREQVAPTALASLSVLGVGSAFGTSVKPTRAALGAANLHVRGACSPEIRLVNIAEGAAAGGLPTSPLFLAPCPRFDGPSIRV